MDAVNSLKIVPAASPFAAMTRVLAKAGCLDKAFSVTLEFDEAHVKRLMSMVNLRLSGGDHFALDYCRARNGDHRVAVYRVESVSDDLLGFVAGYYMAACNDSNTVLSRSYVLEQVHGGG